MSFPIDKKIDKKRLEDAVYLLKSLSNEIKLSSVLFLSDGSEKSVSELMEKIECEQSLLSHHLTDLRAKDILSCRKSGKNCFYSLKNRQVLPLLKCVMNCIE